MQNWSTWKDADDLHSMQDLGCLLDSVAFFSPVRTCASDTLAVNIVMDMETSAQVVQTYPVLLVGDFLGLCDGIWAMAAYYGHRNRQVHPQLTVACAAELLQLDHPNNTSSRRCTYSSDGSRCEPKAYAQQAMLPKEVKSCLDMICHSIRGRVIMNANVAYVLREREAAVRVLAGVIGVPREQIFLPSADTGCSSRMWESLCSWPPESAVSGRTTNSVCQCASEMWCEV